MIQQWQQDNYRISTDPKAIDLDVVHGFLTTSYWAHDIPRELVRKSLENSLCFTLYSENGQVGFGRAITDLATIAYVTDIFILPAYRQQGLGEWLVQCILAHPELQGLRLVLLATVDAHGLYAKHGFVPLRATERFMQVDRDLCKSPYPPTELG